MQTFLCAAILFDLDGVLVDSTRSVDRQWRVWAQEVGVEPERVIEIAHGRRTIEVVRLLAPHLDANAEVVRIERREAADPEGVSVMPGSADLLSSIPPERWCVVTSGTRFLAHSRLQHARLPIPAVLVSADDVTQGKPHPEPYLRGADMLGFRAADCLVIEDAPAGIEAAQAAGMKAIGITSTYPLAELHRADAVIRSLGSLSLGRDGTSAAGSLRISVS
jgi:mannitol-1-/sugar-/sorbitol-6-phosphatase